MKSDFDDAGATAENDPLHILHDNTIQEQCVECVREPPLYGNRVGVLRYNWESERHKWNLPAFPPEFQPSTLHDSTVRQEYCGEKPRPPLDRVFPSHTEKLYSCDQEKSSVSKDYSIQPLKSSFPLKPSVQLPAEKESSSLQPHVLRFSLLDPPEGQWRILCPRKPTDVDKKMKDEQVVLPVFDHKPVRFGLCYYQVAAGVHRHYSDGSTFLVALPDGSAHILCSSPYHRGGRYPSGLLAVIVVPSRQNGSVCIVYDDVDAPDQPMRAIFHSHGRAVCNHPNGQIWLILNGSGGQRFTHVGASTCRWNWSSQTNTPTPLHPLFLSLNKMVGVRVLEKNQVFVCFLAKGKQAKLSVGPCCTQCESKVAVTRPVKQHEEEQRSITSRFHAAAEKLLDCDRALQSIRPRDSSCR